MYGYQDDNVSQGSGLSFGLNQGLRMIKFEYNPNSGKDGAAMEGLDIVFSNGVKEINYRQFPVTKAFDKNNNEILDPKNPAFQDEVNRFNAIMTHIMLCYVPLETYKAALSKPIASFKDFCKVLMQLLPEDFATIELDAFFQFQYTIKGTNNMTYLELPKKVNYGKFLCKHVEPIGSWKEVKIENPATSLRNALYYKDDSGNIHPFIRNGWFMTQPFATQQKEESNVNLAPTNTEGAATEDGMW